MKQFGESSSNNNCGQQMTEVTCLNCNEKNILFVKDNFIQQNQKFKELQKSIKRKTLDNDKLKSLSL